MTLLTIYCLFFKYGLLCVGGGYVLIPMLMADLVDLYGWMSMEEFQKLVAVAQITPGPIGINAATYTGFRLLGVPGGIAGTLGLVSPALLMVTIFGYCMKKFADTPLFQGALAGLRPAGFGLVLAAAWIFTCLAFTGQSGTGCILPALLVTGVFILQIKSRISFVWILLFCGLLGALFC